VKERASAFDRTVLRRAAFFGSLALAYLQYYFLGVLTEIDSLPTVLVFTAAKSIG